MKKDPKIVFADIETLPFLAASFSLYPDSINHENIVQDWCVVCVCWKEQGKKTQSVSVMDDAKRFKADPTDDYHVLKVFRDTLEDVDILVGHNFKKFDRKKINARLIYHGLSPLPKIIIVDTLTELKKVASFTSHRLDYLGSHLLGEGKATTSKGLWLRCLKGERSAIAEMVKYCIKDVVLLEKLYDKILPYLDSHPNVATHDSFNCPKCNSSKVKKDGIRMRASGIKFQTYKCGDCGGYFTDTKSISKPETKL